MCCRLSLLVLMLFLIMQRVVSLQSRLVSRVSEKQRQSLSRLCATKTKAKVDCSLESWHASKGKTLVVVESPAKAKTIQKFLGDEYVVDFSAGHIRDLPSRLEKAPPELKKLIILPVINLNVAHLGVNVMKDFEPVYVSMAKKTEVVTRLKKLAKSCTRIMLATDEDREGEAISWHLVELLKPKVPYKRAVFHEITKEAIVDSFENPRDIDMDLVHSQETRRVLDRLAGYTVSPVLWRYVASGLSAGRVQSCGLNLIAQRERKRWDFVSSDYYSIKAQFFTNESKDNKDKVLESKLHKLDSRGVAGEKDFDGNTGDLVGSKNEVNTVILERDQATDIMKYLSSGNSKFTISDIDSRKTSRKPPAPFITSTLQQAGSNKLRMSPSDTMRVAQELYEEGFITYMRTDSPHLSSAAVSIASEVVKSSFGEDSIENQKKKEKTKSGKEKAPKNAQEAHEAIRPADFEGKFRTPNETGLDGRKKALYGLIYRRTLASVMKRAEYLSKTFSIEADMSNESNIKENKALFRASETITTYRGFLNAMDMTDDGSKMVHEKNIAKEELIKGQEIWLNDKFGSISSSDSFDENNNDDDEEDEFEGVLESETETEFTTDTNITKDAKKNEFLMGGLRGMQHATRPPNRFTESSFIKELEKIGVGRPSTYSKVIETLKSKERKYIMVDGGSIVPTITGLIVSEFIDEHFPDLTHAEFTASMENSLDLIAQGKQDKLQFLKKFYLGDGDVQSSSGTADADISVNEGLMNKVNNKMSNDMIDHKDSRTLVVPFLNDIGTLRIGSAGAFFQSHDNVTISKSFNLNEENDEKDSTVVASSQRWKLPEAMQLDIREISRESIITMMENEATMAGVNMGVDENNNPIVIRSGRYGKFLQIGQDSDKDKKYHSLPKWLDNTISKEEVLEFSQLPMRICQHPNPKLAKPSSPGSELENAYIIAEVSSGQVCVGIEGYPLRIPVGERVLPSLIGADQAIDLLLDVDAVLDSQRTLGFDKDGEEVSIRKGRFGYYIRCGKKIAGLRKLEPSEVTLEMAVEMIDTRGKVMGGGKKKGAAKKKTVKKKATRPASSYINFCSAKRAEVKGQNPDAKLGDMAKILGGLWKELSDDEKASYQSQEAINLKVSKNAALKDKVKKPPSAFINFCSAKRAEVKGQNPDAKLGDMAKLLGVLWKELSDGDKASYQSQEAINLKVSKNDKVKKPPSAYINYCKAAREELVSSNNTITFGEISKILSKQWKELSEMEKENYKI